MHCRGRGAELNKKKKKPARDNGVYYTRELLFYENHVGYPVA
jgi:hypothetical protein